MTLSKLPRTIGALIARHRWAALATVDGDCQPCVSSVAFALERDGGSVLLHLSDLAAHTHNVLAQPNAALLIGEPDTGSSDPQTLARLSLAGPISAISASAEDFQMARSVYLDRLPLAEQRFEFADFRLLRLTPSSGNYVGGFATAHHLDRSAVCDVLALAGA